MSRANEAAQRAADAAIDLAQYLEKKAKELRDEAKRYRAGQLAPEYRNLPADAGPHMRGPVQRAVHQLEYHSGHINGTFERVTKELGS